MYFTNLISYEFDQIISWHRRTSESDGWLWSKQPLGNNGNVPVSVCKNRFIYLRNMFGAVTWSWIQLRGGPPWGPHWHGAFWQRGPASKLSRGQWPWLNYQISQFKLQTPAKKSATGVGGSGLKTLQPFFLNAHNLLWIILMKKQIQEFVNSISLILFYTTTFRPLSSEFKERVWKAF